MMRCTPQFVTGICLFFLMSLVACQKAIFSGKTPLRPSTETSRPGDPPSNNPNQPLENPENPPIDPTAENPDGPGPGGGDGSGDDGGNDGGDPGGLDDGTGGGDDGGADGASDSGGGDDGDSDTIERTFKLSCAAGQNTRAEVDFAAPRSTRVVARVEGEFCPNATNQLTILFVVDYSGSMGHHDSETTGEDHPGHDPQVDGSCGRLRAAQAIVNKVASEMAPEDHIQVGMVPFAGNIVFGESIALKDITDFSNDVTSDHFCQYVIQNGSFGYDPVNPGGISGNGVGSSTNYRAAFAEARRVLIDEPGRKVVYFVSDGEPTSGGADPAQAGIDAGAQLRAEVPNLTLNALLLGYTEPSAPKILESVAGDADRVRKAENADQLASEILKFPKASIKPISGQAAVRVRPNGRVDLGLVYLREDATRGDDVWVYGTQPFYLGGIPGQTTENTVWIEAEGQDGSTHQAEVTIRYLQQ